VLEKVGANILDVGEMVKGFFSFAAEKAGGREGYWNREIDETAP
jgi:hypothetical protein